MAPNPAASSHRIHAPETPALLREIAQAVSSTLDLKELLKIIAQRIAAACRADVCSIFLCNASGERVVPMMSQVGHGSTFTFTLPRQPLVQAQETTTFADTEQTR